MKETDVWQDGILTIITIVIYLSTFSQGHTHFYLNIFCSSCLAPGVDDFRQSRPKKTIVLNMHNRRSNTQTSSKAHLILLLKILCLTWETGRLHVLRISLDLYSLVTKSDYFVLKTKRQYKFRKCCLFPRSRCFLQMLTEKDKFVNI